MYMFLGFLLMLFFSLSVAGNPAVFTPGFSGHPVAVPSGTPLMPLCSNPMDPSCIPQWSQHAIPLAVYPQGVSSPQFQFFLPAFMPAGLLQENLEESDDWEIFTPSFSSSFRSERQFQRLASKKTKDKSQDFKRIFYRDKSDPDRIRIVETDKKGKKVIKEKRGGLGTEEDIQKAKTVEQNPEEDNKWEVFTPPFQEKTNPEVLGIKNQETAQIENTGVEEPSDKMGNLEKRPTAVSTIYQNGANPDQFAVVYKNNEGKEQTEALRAVFVPEDNITRTETEDPEKKPAPKSQSPIGDISSFTTRGDTIAVPATQSHNQGEAHNREEARGSVSTQEETSKSRCIKFSNSARAETEAGFCFECARNEEDSVLPSLIENRNFVAALNKYFSKVASKIRKIIKDKQVLPKQKKSNAAQAQNSLNGSIQKICDPESSLKAVIDNFEKTCPKPYNDFKEFAKKTKCEFCKKGVPPEIMMSIVSIESAGRCSAHNRSGEDSVGLCQVNSKVHQCLDLAGRAYKQGTSENQRCLKNPINSCNKGADILTAFYKNVNDKKPDSSACDKSWLDMDFEEKDSWRRSVSAYNSGPSWVTRAIKSVRDEKALKNTQSLKRDHKRYRTDKISWEKLRVAYFVEKLAQGVQSTAKCGDGTTRERGTGRRISCTIFNLAHTEAVLGRNIKDSTPSMVDIWALYFKDPKNKASCPP